MTNTETIAPTNSDLHDYATGEYVRPATDDELAASIAAAEQDGGAGVIATDDVQRAYVVDA